MSKLSVTSHSKFIQPDFEDSDIEFNANTYRPDFVSGSGQTYKNISQTSPPLFYSNDDLNFNYPSVVLNPHEASPSTAASLGKAQFLSVDRNQTRNVPSAPDVYNAPDSRNAKDGFNAPDSRDAKDGFSAPDTHNARDGFNAPDTHNAKDGFSAPDALNARNGFSAPDGLNARNGFSSTDAHNASAPDAHQAPLTNNQPATAAAAAFGF